MGEEGGGRGVRGGSVVGGGGAAEGFGLAVAFLGVDHEGGLALGAFAFLAADFFAGLLAGGFFAKDLFGQFFAEVAAGEEAVHGLAAFAAAADFEARRDVAQDDGGGGFVDLLATVAAAADEAFVEVGFADAQLLHATEEGEFFFGGDGVEAHGGGGDG